MLSEMNDFPEQRLHPCLRPTIGLHCSGMSWLKAAAICAWFRYLIAILVAPCTLAACSNTAPEQGHARPVILRFPGSDVGAEGLVLRRQLTRFTALHPGIAVELDRVPDAADQRHQLFVQWLNAQSSSPDILPIDTIWTSEFAHARWLLPIEPLPGDAADFYSAALQAATHEHRLYALPWFVDVGMLYWRTDLMKRAPETLEELAEQGRRAPELAVRYGLVLQAARYEGLVTGYLEILGAFGGRWLDESGRVVLDSQAARRALEYLRLSMSGPKRFVPRQSLGWHEEPSRFAFQRGEAMMMRNWPYAARLLGATGSADRSAISGRFDIAPIPKSSHGAGAPTATLGGAHLAINRLTRYPEEAQLLIEYLTAPEQMLERAELSGQLPARRSLYDTPRLGAALSASPDKFRVIIEHAVARPQTPLYTELSQILQIRMHQALTDQLSSGKAISLAAAEMRTVMARSDRGPSPQDVSPVALWSARVGAALLLATLLGLTVRALRQPSVQPSGYRTRTAPWVLMAPALMIVAFFGLLPLGATFWESLHSHDLRMPERGRLWVGILQYALALSSPALWGAIGRTAVFVAFTVSLELLLALLLATALHRSFAGRGLLRTLALLPWALPTVVAALVWRFIFEGEQSPAGALLPGTSWLAHPILTWVPLILADVWKTTPFVTLLILAGLQGIDARFYEAARVDGASRFGQFRFITLPMLRPALLVALVFRTIDALRVFELPYVLTGGGPGTATEPISMFAFTTLLDHLRFGYGSAIGVMVFLCALALALLYVHLLSTSTDGPP